MNYNQISVILNKELVINIVEAKNIAYKYQIDKKVLKNVSFELKRGEFCGLIGNNGAGKTTLVEMFLGMRWPDIGTLTLFGESNTSYERNFLKKISFLSHDINLSGEQTINDFLNFHSYFFPNYSKEIESELLHFFELNRLHKIGSHSTGQQKKIQIVAAMSAQTELIVIDEVTAVLDPLSRQKFFQKLKEHNELYKKSILLATNVVDDLEKCSNKIIRIKNGECTIHGPENITALFGGIS